MLFWCFWQFHLARFSIYPIFLVTKSPRFPENKLHQERNLNKKLILPSQQSWSVHLSTNYPELSNTDYFTSLTLCKLTRNHLMFRENEKNCVIFFSKFQISLVLSLSQVQLFATPWTAAHQASLSITNSRSLPKLMSIESVMPSKHFILCHPLLLLPSIFPTIRVFSNESLLCIRWPKYWSFSISPSNEYSGLISLRMDWFDLLAVQGTLRSLLQLHS